MIKQIIISIALYLLCGINSYAQDMNNKKLSSILYTISDQIEGENGNWQFRIDSTIFICITDTFNNRMRIISPIIETKKINNATIEKCMEANFHSALDARYAIFDGYMWAAYIHPLRENTKDQIIDAVTQVYSCVLTYGTLYSSGELIFPKKQKVNKQENITQQRSIQKF